VRMLAAAMQHAHSTNPDKIVAEMEKTNMEGTLGQLAFYGRNDTYTHALKYGPKYITGTFMQWQDGKQVCVWPENKCPNKMVFPSFVKLPVEKAAAK
jgi:branched-chain amino acid transport system substrate-binding protein